MISANGDREADYTLNDLDPDTGVMRPVATYFGAKVGGARCVRHVFHVLRARSMIYEANFIIAQLADIREAGRR